MLSVTLNDLVLTRGSEFTLGPLSLTLKAGSRTAIVGPSGCGKSTLLRCIAGLERLDSGSVDLGDRCVTDAGVKVSASDRGIGFVFQHGALWPHMTALEQIRFVAPKLNKKAAIAILDRVGLNHAIKRRPAQMSGGEGQRLALARAIAGEPHILLLDEPLASVDVHQRDGLSVLVRTLAEERGLTMLVVTHDRDEALAMADDIVVLRDGKLVEQGSVRELMVSPKTAFTASFLGRATCFPVSTPENALVQTPLGALPVSGCLADAPAQSDGMALVVMPGDLAIVAEADAEIGAGGSGSEPETFRVVSVRPDSFGHWVANVEVAGRTLIVPFSADVESADLAPGGRVALRFVREARFLPYDAAADGDLNKETA